MTELLDDVTDPGLGTLATVLDPVGLATYLLRVLPRHWGALREARVHVLKHHPGQRCTVAIALRTTSGWRELIGKVYAEDRADVYDAMDAISRAGFGPDDAFSIAQPLAFVSDLGLLLQEKVRGTVVKTIFLAGDERDSALATERSALWLARFHALAPHSGPVADLDHHRACFARWERRLAELGGALADKSARLRERLDVAAAALDEADLCAGHCSYSYDHVILSDDRTAVIDWDGYDVADPARDVARFVIALERFAWNRRGSVRAMDANAHVFERTYAAHAQADVAARLPFYKAAICLKLAKYGVGHRVPQWRERVEAMLDEGLRILEQHA